LFQKAVEDQKIDLGEVDRQILGTPNEKKIPTEEQQKPK
jgi:hypothetical protein